MNKSLFSLTYFIVFMLSGCGHNVSVLPQVTTNYNTNIVNIKANFIGNKKYFPDIFDETRNSQLTASLEYDIIYDNDNLKYDKFNLFNPLVLVGFKLGEDSIAVTASLTISSNLKNINRTYHSECFATTTRNLFNNGGTTEIRNLCLNSIKNNFNAQIISDIQKGELNVF